MRLVVMAVINGIVKRLQRLFIGESILQHRIVLCSSRTLQRTAVLCTILGGIAEVTAGDRNLATVLK